MHREVILVARVTDRLNERGGGDGRFRLNQYEIAGLLDHGSGSLLTAHRVFRPSAPYYPLVPGLTCTTRRLLDDLCYCCGPAFAAADVLVRSSGIAVTDVASGVGSLRHYLAINAQRLFQLLSVVCV